MAPLLTPFMVSGKTTSRFDSINTHPLEPLSVRYGVAVLDQGLALLAPIAALFLGWHGHNMCEFILDALRSRDARMVAYSSVLHVPFAACIICESRVTVVPAFRVHVRVRIYPRQSYSRLAQGTCRDALLVIDRASVDRASIFTISEPTERAMQKW